MWFWYPSINYGGFLILILVWCPNCDPVPNSLKSNNFAGFVHTLFIPFLFSQIGPSKKQSEDSFWGVLPNLKIKYRTAMDSKMHIISNLTFTLCAEHLFESRLVRLSFLLDKTSMEALCHFDWTNKSYLNSWTWTKVKWGCLFEFWVNSSKNSDCLRLVSRDVFLKGLPGFP